MDSFFTATGTSPPPKCNDDTRGYDRRPEEPEAICALPEELVEALAGLLAQALVNDIRQYPDLRDLTPAGTPVTAPPETDTRPPSSPQVTAAPQPDPGLAGQPMRRETRAFTEFRNLARPLRLRVTADAGA